MPHIRHELNDQMDDVLTFHRIGTTGAMANIGTGHQRSLDTDDENSNDSDIRALAEIQRAVFGPRDIPTSNQSTSTSHANNIIDLSDAYQQQPLPPNDLLMTQPTIAAGNENGNDLQSEDSERPTFAYLLGSDSTQFQQIMPPDRCGRDLMRETLANQQVPTMDRPFSDCLVPCTAPTLHHYLLFGTINKIGTLFYATKVYYNVKNVDTWVQIVFQSCVVQATNLNCKTVSPSFKSLPLDSAQPSPRFQSSIPRCNSQGFPLESTVRDGCRLARVHFSIGCFRDIPR